MPAATPLDDLLALMKTLQGCIANHGAALRKSEALTRYALIDPLLRELGWDTSDPAQVLPEYAVSGGRADYALLVDGTPQIMVEAKNLGAPLDSAVTQGISYCTEEGTPYFALTDGEHWRLYETHRLARAADKLVVRFSLSGGPVESALSALGLWRARVEVGIGNTGSLVRDGLRDQGQAPESSARRSQHKEPSASLVQVVDAGEWQSLATYEPEAHVSPAEVRFPSGETERTGNWTVFNVRVVAWLVREGHLTQDRLPVQMGTRFVVAAAPSHPDGREFIQPKQAENVFVETNYNAAYILKSIRRVMEVAKCDPSQFRIRLER